MTTKLTLSLVQMDCRLGDPETNFAFAEEAIAEKEQFDGELLSISSQMDDFEGYPESHAKRIASSAFSTMSSSPKALM